MLLPQPPPLPPLHHPVGQAAACSTQFHSRGGCWAAAGDTEDVAGVTVAEICLPGAVAHFYFVARQCGVGGHSCQAQNEDP